MPRDGRFWAFSKQSGVSGKTKPRREGRGFAVLKLLSAALLGIEYNPNGLVATHGHSTGRCRRIRWGSVW